MSLNVIVVGAGIAGLCTAVALRQAGHKVTIFEKSRFAVETGAALVLSSNGARVLSQLGFSFERARGCNITAWENLDGVTLDNIGSLELHDAEKRFGAPLMSVHRVDLHNELLRLALEVEDENPKVDLRLRSSVVSANTKDGEIELADGSSYRADLVVAADGIHSAVKKAILGSSGTVPASTGLSAFRFLIQTKDLIKDPALARMLEEKCNGPTILADTKETRSERHMVWYACQGGAVQNLVGIHPTNPQDDSKADEDLRDSMIREFGHFHPNIQQLIKKATDVSRWPLAIHDPLSRWTYDKVVLIGDAAHPMLPFSGQGSNQAIEDAGALGFLLRGIEGPSEISKRLELFEIVRKKRASRVQVMSKVRVGREAEIQEELRKFADPPGSPVPQTFAERNAHDYGFDVFEKCATVLKVEA